MQVRKLRWLCRFPVMLNSEGHIAEGHVIDLSMSGCAIERQILCSIVST